MFKGFAAHEPARRRQLIARRTGSPIVRREGASTRGGLADASSGVIVGGIVLFMFLLLGASETSSGD